MDYSDSNKRLKSSSGAPISTGAAGLPVYQPPPQITGMHSGRGGANRPRPSASVARPSTQNGVATSLRLTVKAPPSKLRQATSGNTSAIPPNPYTEHSESDDTPAPPVRSARATRNPKVVVDPDSDEEEDDEEEDAEREVDEDEEMGSEEDAEGEEEDEEMMDEHPPAPVIKQQGRGKGQVTVMPPNEGPLKSVEDKEMDDEDEEDDLSELDSGDEIGHDLDDEVDAEGEEDDAEGESDDEDGSRSVTPDLTKLTKRQRGAFEEDPALMALSNEALKKKVLSAEEHVQRRAEMARRRKNLSEKRNEEEKMETINKLLQKQAPKRRTRAEINAANAAAEEEADATEGRKPKVDPLFVKWFHNRDGSRLGVPGEWIDGPVGEVFRGQGEGRRPLVEEVA